MSLVISSIISFLTTYIITPHIMKLLYVAGIVGLDFHKKNKPKLPSSGGLCVASGVIAGLLSYIGIQTFIYNQTEISLKFLAVISTVLIVSFVGLVDDLNVKSRKVKTKEGMDIRVGLPQWIKPLLTLPAAVPLMVINAGNTIMKLPIIGDVNFGILYPTVLVPVGVVGASNIINMLAGFNGSEAGMGIVYSLGLGIFGLLHENPGYIIFFILFSSLIAFIKYNWYPAKILPGDSLTYLLGSVVAAGVIIGNMEKSGIIVLIPFIIEFLLKLRSKFKATCLGRLRKDGKLDPPYGRRIYSLTHLIMNVKPVTEKQVTMTLIIIESVFVIILLLGVV